MDYLQGLLSRTSAPLLQDPAPSQQQLQQMLQAALRAPDHGNLKPMRFLIIEDQARYALGELFLQRQLQKDPSTDEASQQKYRNMPLRAPLIVVLIACLQDHPKVPHQEQIQAAACAGQNILHAAHAQGLGAVWRTGWLAEDDYIKAKLNLSHQEQLLGFIYVGTPKHAPKPIPKLNSQDYVAYWRA